VFQKPFSTFSATSQNSIWVRVSTQWRKDMHVRELRGMLAGSKLKQRVFSQETTVKASDQASFPSTNKLMYAFYAQIQFFFWIFLSFFHRRDEA